MGLEVQSTTILIIMMSIGWLIIHQPAIASFPCGTDSTLLMADDGDGARNKNPHHRETFRDTLTQCFSQMKLLFFGGISHVISICSNHSLRLHVRKSHKWYGIEQSLKNRQHATSEETSLARVFIGAEPYGWRSGLSDFVISFRNDSLQLQLVSFSPPLFPKIVFGAVQVLAGRDK